MLTLFIIVIVNGAGNNDLEIQVKPKKDQIYTNTFSLKMTCQSLLQLSNSLTTFFSCTKL